MTKVEKAQSFISKYHAGQKRKFSGIDYTLHLQETAGLLLAMLDDKASEEEQAAALLHDILEDTILTPEELERHFGSDIKGLVEELTNDEEQKKVMGKKAYLAEKLNQMSEKAFNIKLCDRMSNVMSLADTRTPKKFIKWYVKETEYIIEHLDRDLTLTQKDMIVQMVAFIILLREAR